MICDILPTPRRPFLLKRNVVILKTGPVFVAGDRVSLGQMERGYYSPDEHGTSNRKTTSGWVGNLVFQSGPCHHQIINLSGSMFFPGVAIQKTASRRKSSLAFLGLRCFSAHAEHSKKREPC